MFSGDAGDIVFFNLVLMIFWHLIVLILSIYLNSSIFDPCKKIYQPRKWEKGGAFYIKVLKIKKWKDKLPQYVSKNGFSKRSLSGKLSPQYIDKFITETCRAEWNHLMGCMYALISLGINSGRYAIIFSVLPIALNLPFLFIQRFNRIRLYKLSKRNFSSDAVNCNVER